MVRGVRVAHDVRGDCVHAAALVDADGDGGLFLADLEEAHVVVVGVGGVLF